MKLRRKLLALLLAGWGAIHTASGADANPILLIDPSSMPVAAGRATLTVGALQRPNGVYVGDYKVKVSPYFFKNKKGRLAIVVSDASLARINEGKTTAVIGTATSGGKCRHIDAAATPIDPNHGTLKLWFTAGNRKMIFEPAYHFAETKKADRDAEIAVKTTTSKLP